MVKFSCKISGTERGTLCTGALLLVSSTWRVSFQVQIKLYRCRSKLIRLLLGMYIAALTYANRHRQASWPRTGVWVECIARHIYKHMDPNVVTITIADPKLPQHGEKVRLHLPALHLHQCYVSSSDFSRSGRQSGDPVSDSIVEKQEARNLASIAASSDQGPSCDCLLTPCTSTFSALFCALHVCLILSRSLGFNWLH